MPRRRRRRAGLTALCALALALAGCGAPLPDSVKAGTSAAIGWTHTLTSTNTSSAAGRTAGNLDVAALTRGHFAQTVEGAAVIDESFGTVAISNPETFTVRYDLAEPQWSDGIPVDMADLLLAWAAGSNAVPLAPLDKDPAAADDAEAAEQEPLFESVRTGLQESDQVTDFDEFGRWIEVRFAHPVDDWRTALDVAAPAHVVGERAFGIDDPMEAKQAVIQAIQGNDAEALADIAEVWNTGFDLPEGDGSTIPDDLLLSNGPYRIEQVDQRRTDAQVVQLVANREYTGQQNTEFERIELHQTSAAELLPAVGETLDVVQVPPTRDNWAQIRDLERVDYTVATAHEGRMWTLILNSTRGEFSWRSAREAFIPAVPRADMNSAGAGRWSSAYPIAGAILFAPGDDGYEIAQDDSGLSGMVDLGGAAALAAREEAQVEAGTRICVLYDTDDPFAVAAFGALQDGVREAGWRVRDCGTDDLKTAIDEGTNWDAVLTQVSVPQTPAQIAAQWGTDGRSSLSGSANEDRDALIEQLDRTTDEYEARDLRVQIETSIVADAVAIPLTMQPVVTIGDRDVHGVRPRPGPVAPVLAGAPEWTVGEG